MSRTQFHNLTSWITTALWVPSPVWLALVLNASAQLPPLPPGFKFADEGWKVTVGISTNQPCPMLEVGFQTQVGKFYHMEKTTDFKYWYILEPEIEGDGKRESFFDVIAGNAFYRLYEGVSISTNTLVQTGTNAFEWRMPAVGSLVVYQSSNQVDWTPVLTLSSQQLLGNVSLGVGLTTKAQFLKLVTNP